MGSTFIFGRQGGRRTPNTSATVFTLRVRKANGEIVAREESLPGESWLAMLARLVEPTGPGEARPSGRADDPWGPIETLIFETAPPQL